MRLVGRLRLSGRSAPKAVEIYLIHHGALLLGLGPLFDPRVVFVAESTSKGSFASPFLTTRRLATPLRKEHFLWLPPLPQKERTFPLRFLSMKEGCSERSFKGVDVGVTRVFSIYIQPDSLVGMVDAIYRRGPWSLQVSPCRAHELVCEGLAKDDVGVGRVVLLEQPAEIEVNETLMQKLQDRFFYVSLGEIGPNLLADSSNDPFFPIHWTCQSAVSIVVKREDLEE
ncbi:hypothetical protein CR513_07867, partial [Mucuna pruriens]